MQEQLAEAWGGGHIGSMISAYYVAYALTGEPPLVPSL
jgi:hypothetical protein